MTTTIELSDRLARAALSLAAERPWRAVTLAEIAKTADVPLADLYGWMGSTADVADAVAQLFDRLAAREFELDLGVSLRERVFEAAMARFDAMEPHRAGLVSILDEARFDPVRLARRARRLSRSARWLLGLAGVDTGGAAGLARVEGFALILAETERAWVEDAAGDLARTMRTLDRRLRDVEAWGQRFGRPGRTAPAADPRPDEGPAPIRLEDEPGASAGEART